MQNNNPSEIHYYTFYIFFRTLGIITCLLIAIDISASWLDIPLFDAYHIFFNNRVTACRKLVLFGLLIFLLPFSGLCSFGVCMMAAGGSLPDSELLYTGLGLSVVGYVFIWIKSTGGKTCSQLLTFHARIVFGLCMMAGFIVLSMFFEQMNEVQIYEYHGPMYILNLKAKKDDSIYSGTCGDSLTCFDEGYRAELKVGWGDDCPSYPDQWCESIVTDQRCDRQVCEEGDCSDEQRQEAKEAVLNCLRERYRIPNHFDFKERNDSPLILPTLPSWPSATFFGDCSTCSAQLSVPLHNALSIRNPGSILTCIGTFGLVVVLLESYRMSQKNQVEHRPLLSSDSMTGTLMVVSQH